MKSLRDDSSLKQQPHHHCSAAHEEEALYQHAYNSHVISCLYKSCTDWAWISYIPAFLGHIYRSLYATVPCKQTWVKIGNREKWCMTEFWKRFSPTEKNPSHSLLASIDDSNAWACKSLAYTFAIYIDSFDDSLKQRRQWHFGFFYWLLTKVELPYIWMEHFTASKSVHY